MIVTVTIRSRELFEEKVNGMIDEGFEVVSAGFNGDSSPDIVGYQKRNVVSLSGIWWAIMKGSKKVADKHTDSKAKHSPAPVVEQEPSFICEIPPDETPIEVVPSTAESVVVEKVDIVEPVKEEAPKKRGRKKKEN